MRIVAGVDCHKSSHAVAFLNAVGEVIECFSIPTSEVGYERALSAGARLGCREWGLEGAGCYGYAFGVFVAAQGCTVLEVPGVLTKRHRRHSSVRGKSDATDARAIAEVVLRETGRLPGFHRSAVQRALRLRYDQRDRQVRARTSAANRLRMAAVLIGVTDLPRDITSTKAATRLASQALASRSAIEDHPAVAAILDDLQEAAEEIVRLNGRIRATEHMLRSLVGAPASDLLAVHGVSTVVASGLVGHAVQVVEPKSARSKRTIALPGIVVKALNRHRVRQLEARLAAGQRWQDSGFVFTTPNGTTLDARNITRAFKDVLTSQGLPAIRIHDLRHSCATLMLAQGVSPRVVMDTLGHSQISLTLNTYSHVLPTVQEDAASKMDAILQSAKA